MSNLRTRASEIKAAGEAERGNFEPTGAPKRLYQYWLSHSTTSRADKVRTGLQRENFCHFWRVVAIWAPLMFLRRGVVKAAENRFVQIAVAIVLAVTFVYALTTLNGWDDFLWILAGALAIVVATTLVVFTIIGVKKVWRK